VISEDALETRQIAERFLREIGFSGIAAAEFKKDPASGQLKIIEINPRPSLWFSTSTAAHKSVALASYSDLTGALTLPQEREQDNGVLWRYALKDSYSTIFYKLNKGFVLPPPDIGPATYAHRRVSATSEVGDRAPARAELYNYVTKGVRRLLDKWVRWKRHDQ
jgi:hypothetical protein